MKICQYFRLYIKNAFLVKLSVTKNRNWFLAEKSQKKAKTTCRNVHCAEYVFKNLPESVLFKFVLFSYIQEHLLC